MEMNFENLKKKWLNKKGISLLSQILIIALVFIIDIVTDYLKLGGDGYFVTDVYYWINIGIQFILIATLMITVRAMRKEKKCDESKTIYENLFTISIARKVVLGNQFSEKLQKHLDKVNEYNKYDTYVNKITKKINNLPRHIFWSKAKKERKLVEYEKALQEPMEKVIRKHFRYKKVTQTGLFAGIDGKIAVYNQFDTQTHEGKDVGQMLGYKAIVMFLLTAFGGTIVADFVWNGWSAIWSTLLKLFALLMATISALKQAENFVDYNIEQALDNRIRIILDFVNANEDVKSKFLEKKQSELEK